MTNLGHYFLLALLAISALAWAANWIFTAAARGKHWLALTAALSMPIAVIGLWWWSWPLLAISFLPQPWNNLEFIIVACLAISLLASTIRFSGLSFAQAVGINWLRYVLSISGMLLLGQIAASLPWPSWMTFSAALLAVALLLSFKFANRQVIIWQGICLISSQVVIILLGLIVSQLALGNKYGLAIAGWHIGWGWPHIALLAAFSVAWPVICLWWFNQNPARKSV